MICLKTSRLETWQLRLVLNLKSSTDGLEPYIFKFTAVTLNHFDVMTNPVSCQQLLKFSHFVLNREAVLKFSTYELL